MKTGWFLTLLMMALGTTMASANADGPGKDGPAPVIKTGDFRLHESTLQKLTQKVSEIRLFAAARGYNTERVFLADMGVSSGQYRFFVYNLKNDSLEMAGLVSHGIGSNTASGKLRFSNEAGSYQTSLGKYAIGQSYQGKFGLAFKLNGLDQTNSRAYERAVVLHANDCVPNEEIAPLGVCESLGCPIVSRDMLAKLQPLISKTSNKTLLWIYE